MFFFEVNPKHIQNGKESYILLDQDSNWAQADGYPYPPPRPAPFTNALRAGMPSPDQCGGGIHILIYSTLYMYVLSSVVEEYVHPSIYSTLYIYM